MPAVLSESMSSNQNPNDSSMKSSTSSSPSSVSSTVDPSASDVPSETFEPESAKPVQFIEISSDGESFHLDEEKLRTVLEKAPRGMKVSVISVVGAFRTGIYFIF